MQLRDKETSRRHTVVLALVCALLQLALAPNIALGSGHANFAFVFVACYALFVPGRSAVVAGFLAGLFFDLSSTTPVGLMALCLSVLGFALSQDAWTSAGSTVAGSCLVAAVSSLVVSFFCQAVLTLVGQAGSFLETLGFSTLPSALLSAVAFVPFALALCRPQGPSLGGPKGGSHFSLKGL